MVEDNGTTSGKVSTYKKTVPPHENSRNRDLTLFIPYGEMHINGTYNLKYFVEVHCNRGKRIGTRSNWETFKLTWRTNVPESDCPKCGC